MSTLSNTCIDNIRIENHVRDRPFNLKGEGGAMVLFGENNFVSKFDEKKNSVSDMGRRKYSESTLCLKKLVFIEKNNVAKNNSAAPHSDKSHKPPPQPHPLHGWSLNHKKERLYYPNVRRIFVHVICT